MFFAAFCAAMLLCGSVCAQTPAPSPNEPTEVESFATTLIAISPQERNSLLAEKKQLVTPDLRKVLIRRGNTQLAEGSYSTAYAIYDLAKNIAEQIGDKEGVASAALDIGTVYYFQANYPAALEHYQKARELFREVPNDYESAKALSGLALIYKEQRRDKEALVALKQALDEFKSLGDKEEMGNTLNSIGTIYYGQGNYTAAADAFMKSSEANNTSDNLIRLADSFYMQGDYSLALNYYQQSIDKLDKNRDAAGLIAALNGAANSSYYQGNFDEALRYYERNLPIQQTMRDRVGVANSLKGIGNVYRARNEYPAALDNYYKSLNLSEQLKTQTGSINGSIGLVRALQGNYDQALQFYQKALADFEANGNKIDTGRALSLIGNVNYAQGNYEAALQSYRRGLTLREESDDKLGQGDVLSGIGSTFLRLRNYPEALNSYQKALVQFDAIANKSRTADVLTRVADTFLLQGEYAKGLSAAESALSLATQLKELDTLWYAQTLAGKAQLRLDHETQAVQAFKDSVATVEKLRTQPGNASGSERDSSEPYLLQVELLMSQHHPGEAFDYAERAKTESLIELLRNGNAIPRQGLSVEEQSEEQRLIGAINSLELQLERETQLRTSTEARVRNLQERLAQARQAYADNKQALYKAHPELKILRGELPALTLSEMRSLVTDNNTALLEYAVTPENTYLFVLTNEQAGTRRRTTPSLSLKVYPLEIKNYELAPRVREFEESLASRSENFNHLARELYDILIKPAGDQLLLKTRLVVVPDGVLKRLPFEALQPVDNHYVIDQAQVTYAPSLSALREMRKKRARRPNSALVAFGNPLLSKDFETRFDLAYSGAKLDSNIEQQESMQQIATAYHSTNTQLLSATDASEERLKAEATRAGILHFATPVLLDDTTPMSSFVALAPGMNKQNEGFLQPREIMNSKSSAQLVVMPATQQRSGFSGAAEFAMAWSWFAAGTPSTLLGRWDVKSPALNQFLSTFYWKIRPGTKRIQPSKSNALRESILSLRKSAEYQHPYYWAGFALIGDAQ